MSKCHRHRGQLKSAQPGRQGSHRRGAGCVPAALPDEHRAYVAPSLVRLHPAPGARLGAGDGLCLTRPGATFAECSAFDASRGVQGCALSRELAFDAEHRAFGRCSGGATLLC